MLSAISSTSIVGVFSGLASVGDLDGNGVGDLATLSGNLVAFRFLHANGAVLGTRSVKIGFGGLGLAPLGDLTGDGIPDLAAGFVPLGSALSSRVLLLQLGGIATAGFEHRDNADERPLENGRAIPRPHPGRTFVVSSSGANLGATAFDSSPTGPNAGDDLCVDSGNVLILQDSLEPTQSTPGIFNDPHDDPDSGLLAFDFPRRIRAFSIDLADIDELLDADRAQFLRGDRADAPERFHRQLLQEPLDALGRDHGQAVGLLPARGDLGEELVRRDAGGGGEAGTGGNGGNGGNGASDSNAADGGKGGKGGKGGDGGTGGGGGGGNSYALLVDPLSTYLTLDTLLSVSAAGAGGTGGQSGLPGEAVMVREL